MSVALSNSQNKAAAELIAPRDGELVGNPIAAFLPQLHHALRWEEGGPHFGQLDAM